MIMKVSNLGLQGRDGEFAMAALHTYLDDKAIVLGSPCHNILELVFFEHPVQFLDKVACTTLLSASFPASCASASITATRIIVRTGFYLDAGCTASSCRYRRWCIRIRIYGLYGVGRCRSRLSSRCIACVAGSLLSCQAEGTRTPRARQSGEAEGPICDGVFQGFTVVWTHRLLRIQLSTCRWPDARTALQLAGISPS